MTALRSTTQVAAQTGRIKGLALRHFFVVYEQRFGLERASAALERMPDHNRALFRIGTPGLGVLSANWYPAEPVHALMDALIVPLTQEQRTSLAQEAASQVMTANLNSVYRGIFRAMATPHLYARYGHKFWSLYYDTGQVTFREEGARAHRAEITGWTSHHPYICYVNVLSNVTIYEAMGVKQARATRTRCVGSGAPCCEYRIEWEG